MPVIKGPFTIKVGEELPDKVKAGILEAGYKPPFKNTHELAKIKAKESKKTKSSKEKKKKKFKIF